MFANLNYVSEIAASNNAVYQRIHAADIRSADEMDYNYPYPARCFGIMYPWFYILAPAYRNRATGEIVYTQPQKVWSQSPEQTAEMVKSHNNDY